MISKAIRLAIYIPAVSGALFGLTVKKPKNGNPGECMVESKQQGSAIFHYEESSEPSLTVTELFCNFQVENNKQGVDYKVEGGRIMKELAPALNLDDNKRLSKKLKKSSPPFEKCKAWVLQAFKTARNKGEVKARIRRKDSKFIGYLCQRAKQLKDEGGDEEAQEGEEEE